MRAITIDVDKRGALINLALAEGRRSGQVVLVLSHDVQMITQADESSSAVAPGFHEYEGKGGFPPRRLTEHAIVQVLREHGGSVRIRDEATGWNIYELLKEQMAAAGIRVRQTEEERHRSRQGEVSSLIAETTLAKLEREVEQMRIRQKQGALLEEAEQLAALDRSIEEREAEIARRRRHHEEVRVQLDRERERFLKHLLPKRYAMSGAAQVFPVAVEVRLPR